MVYYEFLVSWMSKGKIDHEPIQILARNVNAASREALRITQLHEREAAQVSGQAMREFRSLTFLHISPAQFAEQISPAARVQEAPRA